MSSEFLAIGAVARTSGRAPSAIRYYESIGLLPEPVRVSGRRRYPADVLQSLAVIDTAQRAGLTLDDIRAALASLPDQRTPTAADWARLSKSWRPLLDARIAELERMRDNLASCIGCGCLSLKSCALSNPDDVAATFGSGPRWLFADD